MVRLPDILESLIGNDVTFEHSISQSFQSMELRLVHNTVVEAYAVVFVNNSYSRDDLPPRVYSDAELVGEDFAEIFRDNLQCETKIVTQPTQTSINDELARLRKLAEAFEKSHAKQTTLVLAIAWVGWTLTYKYHPQIILDKIKPIPGRAADGTEVSLDFQLTSTGHAIHLPHLCEELTRMKGV